MSALRFRIEPVPARGSSEPELLVDDDYPVTDPQMTAEQRAEAVSVGRQWAEDRLKNSPRDTPGIFDASWAACAFADLPEPFRWRMAAHAASEARQHWERLTAAQSP